MHTNGGKLGLVPPLGHADYYPNGGGLKQPGCGTDQTGSCAHGRAYMYYAESLTNPDAWYAVMCNSTTKFNAGECEGNAIEPFPRWEPDYNKPSGLYQLRTADSDPYGLGMDGTKPDPAAASATPIESTSANAPGAVAAAAQQ